MALSLPIHKLGRRQLPMTFLDWIPAVSTTGLFALALWLGRNLLITRLSKSVEHEFNEKLEALRAQLRQGEERLKADLRTKEAEIAALRSGAMAALASRQMAVDNRRLEAVDQLWAAAMSLGPARAISSWLSVIKFETAAEKAERDPKLRQFFEMIGTGFDMKSLNLGEAAKARPFVSPMAWATYSALVAIAVHAVMRWQILKSGLGKQDFADIESINKLLKVALPHHANYIDKYGASGYNFLLEELETKLLRELQSMLAGSDADKANVEQAAEILRQSDEVLKQARSGAYAAQQELPADGAASRR